MYIIETKPNLIPFPRRRATSADAFYSDCLEKRFTIDKESPYLVGML